MDKKKELERITRNVQVALGGDETRMREFMIYILGRVTMGDLINFEKEE